MSGDRRLAVLVLAAVIDYHLHESDARRAAVGDVERMLGLFREAWRAVERGEAVL